MSTSTNNTKETYTIQEWFSLLQDLEAKLSTLKDVIIRTKSVKKLHAQCMPVFELSFRIGEIYNQNHQNFKQEAIEHSLTERFRTAVLLFKELADQHVHLQTLFSEKIRMLKSISEDDTPTSSGGSSSMSSGSITDAAELARFQEAVEYGVDKVMHEYEEQHERTTSLIRKLLYISLVLIAVALLLFLFGKKQQDATQL